jgi:hypothetical protein
MTVVNAPFVIFDAMEFQLASKLLAPVAAQLFNEAING